MKYLVSAFIEMAIGCKAINHTFSSNGVYRQSPSFFFLRRAFLVAFLVVLPIFMTACQRGSGGEEAGKRVDSEAQKLAQLAQGLQNGAKAGVELGDPQCEEMSSLLRMVLPEVKGDLAGYSWEVSCNKETDDQDIFFSLELNREIEGVTEQAMWFHIIYNPHMSVEERESYGSEVFDGYRANRAQDAHLWILVNNFEIRAVAETADFKNSEKIAEILRAFKLKEMAKL